MAVTHPTAEVVETIAPVEPQPTGEQEQPRGQLLPALARRLQSLDAFRGLTILGMLMVNNMALGAAMRGLFAHAPWNGSIHFADLVFPWFLLIVGVALPFSAAAFREKGGTLRRYLSKVFTRAVVLVLLGLLVDSSIIRTPFLGLGVLQIIGLAYFTAALAALLPLRYRLPLASLLLLGHWAAIRFIPLPGLAAGTFTEQQNLIAYLNQTYLASWHLSGLISLIPTTALVIIGTALGELLRHASLPPLRKWLALTVIGLLLMLGGWLWNLDLPFNKAVWTPSFIVFTGGLGAVVLGFFYLTIEIRGWRSWAFPLVVFGANAIMAYALPILAKTLILQVWTWPMPDGASLSLLEAYIKWLIATAGRIPGGWLYTASYILCWWLILLYLYRKRLFLRV